MPDGPPPGMSREEEEEDTDDDIPMPDGPPPGSSCKLYLFNAQRPPITRPGSVHIIAPPHPASAATTSRLPCRHRRLTAAASWFPQRALPSSPSRVLRTTAPTPTRLPWHRAAPRRIHPRASGVLKQPPSPTAGLLPATWSHTDRSNFGAPRLCYPRQTSSTSSTCSGNCGIDGDGIGRGAVAGF